MLSAASSCKGVAAASSSACRGGHTSATPGQQRSRRCTWGSCQPGGQQQGHAEAPAQLRREGAQSCPTRPAPPAQTRQAPVLTWALQAPPPSTPPTPPMRLRKQQPPAASLRSRGSSEPIRLPGGQALPGCCGRSGDGSRRAAAPARMPPSWSLRSSSADCATSLRDAVEGSQSRKPTPPQAPS